MADELPRRSRLNATSPVVLFDGTPMGGGSGRCGKGFRARAWAGSGAAAHRLAGSAPRPAADQDHPSTSATAGHPAAQLSLGAMVWSRRASSRSIAPTGGGRAAAGGSRLESLLDSQLGLERAGRAALGPGKGPRLINLFVRLSVIVPARVCWTSTVKPRDVGRAAGQGGWDLRKSVVLAHNRLALPRSAPCRLSRRK